MISLLQNKALFLKAHTVSTLHIIYVVLRAQLLFSWAIFWHSLREGYICFRHFDHMVSIISLNKINSSSLWLYNTYIPLSMAIFGLQKSISITPVIFCYQWPISISWPCESKHFLLFPTWFPFRKFLNLNIPNWQMHTWNCT